MAGYSGKPLVEKLGIKSGSTVCILNAPNDYQQTLGKLPTNVSIINGLTDHADFIQFFIKDKKTLEHEFSKFKKALKSTGMLWISWPKQSSKVQTDLNENIVMQIGLANGLVDVKVAAIDDIWSGLKFVYRRKDR